VEEDSSSPEAKKSTAVTIADAAVAPARGHADLLEHLAVGGGRVPEGRGADEWHGQRSQREREDDGAGCQGGAQVHGCRNGVAGIGIDIYLKI
jgi:hypothetical protein